MKQPTTFILLAAVVSQAYTAPQFITFNDGKLGVNFGGYHAAVGLGGLLGNNGGAGGGLFAEAGTPYGQGARAGLGGSVAGNGGSAGGLYAGATAGGNTRASAGLSGGVTPDKTAGIGFASAQSGNHFASSGLGGDTSNKGGAGFLFSGTNSFGISNGVVKETEFAVKPIETVKPVETSKPVPKKVHKEFDVDAANEVNFVPLTPNNAHTTADVSTKVQVKTEVKPAVAVENIHVDSPQVVEKHVVHRYYKPRNHLRKTAYIGGFVGSDAAVPTVNQYQPAIEKRIDVGVQSSAGANAGVTHTQDVVIQRNPNFFADIFNIPISALKAVSNFLGNAAASTSVSVQKSGSLQADSESVSSKHVPLSSSSSSDTQITVQTPNVSKVIDDILSIPINTLGAVNKFLENNVPARKRIQISQQTDGSEVVEQRHARLGPHARRRANKQVVVLQEEPAADTKN